MGKSHFSALLFLGSLIFFFFLPLFNGGLAMAGGTPDGSEKWGYVEVRPKAHMFWWYYKSPYRTQDPNNPWPVILWLQGGPGASGVGTGNFEEVGPLDSFLKPRNSTWLTKADLLFVDNPVGTGYSFVEDENLLVKTDEEAATDLTTLLTEIFNRNETLQKSPLYIVAESYGGKFAVTLGLSALKAIEDKKLKLIFGGIALGDTWISPEDFVASWGPLLKDISRIDDNGLIESNSLVEKIKQQIANGKLKDATETWSDLEDVIDANTNSVDFYNFLLDSGMDPVSMTATELVRTTPRKRYLRYLDSLKTSPGENGDLDLLMNGVIRKKLGIIPNDVEWGGQSGLVFQHLEGDFMRPRINEVDELLNKGVNVTIYSGQLDVICSTKGTHAWVEKLKWEGLKTFLSIDRIPLYCGHSKITKGFTKSYKNLHFYWILEAGHFVPVDQPCVALNMIGRVTSSHVYKVKDDMKKQMWKITN
ncbi:putative carboxypeptidase C [Helianthus annuus]|uniref:Carboxypeptidase n=1 Tax=Helianthus annuus TaxID=4232 RepID=A0A251VI28_HELAN|nr:serine carboxypeptidase-like 51 isoform X1 [Helianthus annuus]KAF5819789.1 putative carboxypeptidase C [Helianthus annuus]KAJ0605907.1 putative carboxypeptidase C [Helianthus annuus]KAJ0616795.1 putative carboxypeptidase C [Helianthus annuus]KAJ0619902.1 putative carboxypeptidase C [Helianthus annuus]KAJ0787334.1 putative carboxypeptidase C [Helianthus annuus]